MPFRSVPLVQRSTYKLLVNENQDISFLAGSTFPLGFICDSDATINANLSVGASSNHKIECTGDIIAFATSDKKLKDNITLISDPIDKIFKLSGNTFVWNKKSPPYSRGNSDIGVIAQEVETIIPEAVREVDGVKSVRYEKIIPLLIECVKEQQIQINELKNKLEGK